MLSSKALIHLAGHIEPTKSRVTAKKGNLEAISTFQFNLCLGLGSSILTTLDLIDYYEPADLSCRVGYFMCNDTRLCIAQKLNCDSEANCYDGSDEWNCSDSAANFFWDSLYRKNVKAVTDDIPWGTCRKRLL